MLQIIFALLAGILTVGAPCILPLLPILLGTSVGQTSKTRPLFISFGFVVMFVIVGLVLSVLTTTLQLSPNTLRTVAIFALALFGALMLFPKPFELLAQRLAGLTTKANAFSKSLGTGNASGFVLGLTLGLIWTPCAGPVLGSILTLIATQTNVGGAGILLTAYAIGAGIPMLAIAYGGQYITTRVRAISRYTTLLQQIFGVLILGLAVAMFFQFDTLIQARLVELYDFGNIEQAILSRFQ
jgi:cytochrome c biogenesis protein CcdA